MIQTIPPATPGTPAMLPGMLGVVGENIAETADFSILLDGLAAQLLPGSDQEVPPNEPTSPVIPAMPAPAWAATPGKILPLAVPVDLQPTAQTPVENPEVAVPAAAGQVKPQAAIAMVERPIPSRQGAEIEAAIDTVEDPEQDPAASAKSAALDSARPAPAPAPAPLPAATAILPALAVQPAEPEWTAPRQEPAPSAQNRTSVAQVDLAPPRPVPQGQPALAETMVGIARSKTGETATTSPAPPSRPVETVHLDLPLQAPAAPGHNAQVQPAAPPTQVRPHEFDALIDRLAAAREGVAAHTVSLTVAHQDFGPVRLHFRPDELGMSVSLSSADPDFARIAAAAPAPVLPVQAGEPTTSTGQRTDTSGQGSGSTPGNNAHSHGSAQSRGGSSDRREEPRPSPGHQPRAEADSPGQRGIFA